MDPKTYEEARNRIRELEAKIEEYKEYVRKLEAENERLKRQAKDNNQRMSSLEMRNPVIALASLEIGPKDEFEVWEEDNSTNSAGKGGPKTDLSKRQGSRWNGDMALGGESTRVGYYIVRDTPPGVEFRFVLKVVKHDPAGPPIVGWMAIESASGRQVVDNIRITQQQVAVPIAVAVADGSYKTSVRVALPKEFSSK